MKRGDNVCRSLSLEVSILDLLGTLEPILYDSKGTSLISVKNVPIFYTNTLVLKIVCLILH